MPQTISSDEKITIRLRWRNITNSYRLMVCNVRRQIAPFEASQVQLNRDLLQCKYFRNLWDPTSQTRGNDLLRLMIYTITPSISSFEVSFFARRICQYFDKHIEVETSTGNVMEDLISTPDTHPSVRMVKMSAKCTYLVTVSLFCLTGAYIQTVMTSSSRSVKSADPYKSLKLNVFMHCLPQFIYACKLYSIARTCKSMLSHRQNTWSNFLTKDFGGASGEGGRSDLAELSCEYTKSTTPNVYSAVE